MLYILFDTALKVVTCANYPLAAPHVWRNVTLKIIFPSRRSMVNPLDVHVAEWYRYAD